MNQIHISLVVLLVFTGICSAQFEVPSFVDPNPGDEVFAAPETAAFQKYNFLPVNLYTGKVQVNIPIYEISVGKIKVPIGLSYNSGGVKVDDVASSVGLGWNLNAGGNILRVIRDIDDAELNWENYDIPDDTGDNAGSTEHETLVAGYHRLNSTYEYTIGSVRIGDPNNAQKIDASPDAYIVNAPGLSTKFYLEDIDTNNPNFLNKNFAPVFLDNSGIYSGTVQRSVIQQTYLGFTGDEDGNPSQSLSINTSASFFPEIEDFGSFSFTNTNGLTYTFDSENVLETRQLPVFFSNWYKSYENRISSWNLDQIHDASTNETINFEYETYQRAQPEVTHNFKGRQGVHSSATGLGCFFEHMSYDGSVSSGFDEIYSNETLTKYTKLHRLTKITWQGGSVEFIYGLNRSDAIGEKALTEIKIKDKDGNEIKRFVLEQSYFDSKEGCADAECKRLRLDEVKNVADDGTYISHNLEYDYTNPLPRRNSLQKDYLGFYNNNGSTYNLQSFFNQAPSPELYFYPNEGIYSILPFEKTGVSNYREITGSYSLTPNTYSLSGLLNKITYPTGGFSEFEYENHTFRFEGQEYIAGGARILRQRINDANGQERVLEYKYEETDGVSSGYINNIPVYGYPNTAEITLSAANPTWQTYFTAFDKARSGLELTHGNFIGYARIIETEVGNGYTEYLYTSPKDFPNVQEQRSYSGGGNGCQDFLIDNSAYPGLTYIDNDMRRGKLRFTKVFDEDNQLLRRIENQYQYVNFETLSLAYEAPMLTEPPGLNPIQSRFYISVNSEINIERYLTSKTIKDEDLTSGNLITTEEFVYDPSYPFLKESIMTDSEGDTQKKKYTYVSDFAPSTSTVYQNLHNENRLVELIELESSKNTTVLEKNEIEYAVFPSGLTQPSILKAALGNDPLEERLQYAKYDGEGNLLQMDHEDSGIKICYIWGYNKQYPIAKIEGPLTYDQADQQLQNVHSINFANLQTLSDQDIDSASEQALRDAQNQLRNALKDYQGGSMVTTYTYDNMLGVTSMTDPREYTTYYEYDEFDRLEIIKDADGNLLSENRYHYKNQQ